MTAEDLVFLDVDDVLELHAAQLDVFGGGSGLRDRGLLESAVAQPQVSIDGQYAHDGLDLHGRRVPVSHRQQSPLR